MDRSITGRTPSDHTCPDKVATDTVSPNRSSSNSHSVVASPVSQPVPNTVRKRAPATQSAGNIHEADDDNPSAHRVYRHVLELDPGLQFYDSYAGQARQRIEAIGA